VDKSDDEFEAFLLEVLSDYQVSIPEIGTIHSVTKPFVVLTSNNTRELSEASISSSPSPMPRWRGTSSGSGCPTYRTISPSSWSPLFRK
jgi:hypothetical protein